MSALPTVTIIAPCYNEAEGIRAFYHQVKAVTAQIPGYQFELLLVDDGSRDETPAHLRALAEADPAVRVLRLARNFGHQRAITAGLDHCQGDYVIVMDADLQDPPEAIPEILAGLAQGADLVHTVRVDRSQDSFAKRASAKIFYAVMRRWVLPELPEGAGDYKGFNRQVLLGIRQYRERVRFLRGAFATVGFQQATVPIVRPSRYAGHSKFPLRQVLRFGRDALVSNTVIPLRIALYLGIATLALLPLVALALILLPLTGLYHPDPLLAILLCTVLLYGGLGLFFTGFTGEYLKCLILEAKQRPLYLVGERINLDPAE
jgi:dolichol-phosphate mannosyltransferase